MPADEFIASEGSSRSADVFGDGAHPSTEGLAAALEAALAGRSSAVVLDAGCGTGQLAALAVAHGANVVAIDHHRPAVLMCAARAPEALVEWGELGSHLANRPGSWIDVVAANLPEPALLRLAPLLLRALRPGGVILASGVILSRASRVRRRFEALGLQTSAIAHRGWLVLSASLR